MKNKVKTVEEILEETYPEKTPLAIQIMLRAVDTYRSTLLEKLQGKKNLEEIIKIIEEFK